MNNLIGSSAWIEFFRGNKKYLFLNELINANAICTNDIILTELLPSILHKNGHELAGLLKSITNYPLTINWEEIRFMQLENLKKGNNNIGISDLIIVQNCIQNNLRLIVSDKHFDAMAKYFKLEIFKA